MKDFDDMKHFWRKTIEVYNRSNIDYYELTYHINDVDILTPEFTQNFLELLDNPYKFLKDEFLSGFARLAIKYDNVYKITLEGTRFNYTVDPIPNGMFRRHERNITLKVTKKGFLCLNQ